ncbi:S-layer homology domain-containing protein [Peptoniphilus sp. MSJ-1]|uniref:S-layer homology domain-containing protein n=1 Tax=Peptoniphilus ovalis TaxID=2841503 RepID=A0ABS6FE84_9FIRM|nr:S-layer homology domain-containing protein [Peptoniphilus ovalis]MBU5668496.1 S-layer homology domain-containing protein [Peptoniphilus ovalis]
MNKKILTSIVLASALLAPQTILAKGFKDVPKNAWYHNTITELSDKGIITGYEDNTFKPNKKVTYAEFLTLLNNKIGQKQAQNTDPNKLWYKDTFDYLKQNGVIEKIENPNAEIPRKEMAKYLAKGLEKLQNEKQNTKAPEKIKDFNTIEEAYKPYVATGVNLGILTGDENGNFHAEDSLTRAEAATIIKNLDKYKAQKQEPQKPQPQTNDGTYGGIAIKGVDTFFGKPYEIPKWIMDKYPQNRQIVHDPQVNLTEEDYKDEKEWKIIDKELLQKYGMSYIEEVEKKINNPESDGGNSYERFSGRVVNDAIATHLDNMETTKKFLEENPGYSTFD